MCCAMLSRSVVSDSLWPHGLQPARLLCPWEFSRKEHRTGLPWPPPGDLSDPGIEPRSSSLQVDSLPAKTPGKPNFFSFFFFFFFNINWNTFGYSPALGTSIHVKNTEDCNFLEKTTGDSSKGESGQWTQLSRCYMKEEENISKVCLMLPVMNLAVRVKVSWYCKDIWDWFC